MRWRTILIVGGLGCIAIAGFAAFAVYNATRSAPAFYVAALATPPETHAEHSDEFLNQALALASDVETRRDWQAIFRAEQINGWLATDLPKNYPTLLPKTLGDPRVELREHQVTIAARLEYGGISGIGSMTGDVFACGERELAVVFHRAAWGAMPIPLGRVLGPLRHELDRLGWQTRWQEYEGSPAVVIGLGEGSLALAANDTHSHGVALDCVAIHTGKVLIAGHKADGPVVAQEPGSKNTR